MLPGKQFTLVEMLHIAWQRRWLILIPWVLIAALTAGVAHKLPDRYRSETTILIVPPRVPEAYVRSTVTSKIGERLPAISQEILSRTRLERIIEDFNLYAEERKTEIMEDIVRDMRRDIFVEMVKGDAFQVRYTSTDATTAMKVTERLGSLFVEQNLRDREVLAEGTNEFLESQLEDARKRLLEQEKALEEYRRQHTGELPTQMQSNLQVIQSAQNQLQAFDESINRDRDRRLLLERTLTDLTASTSAPRAPGGPLSAGAPAAESAEGALGDLSVAAQLEGARSALTALELRLKPEHPDLVRMARKVRDLEAKVKAESKAAADAGGNPSAAARTPSEILQDSRIRDVRAEIENVDRQIGRKEESKRKLLQTIAEYQRRVEVVPTRESELIALSRDYETLQRIYNDLLGKNESSKVAANLERRQIGEQFKIIDQARVAEKPYSPNRIQIDALGILGGLLVGLGLVGLIEVTNTSLRTEADVLALLSLPVLAAIPTIETDLERKTSFRRRLLFAGAAAVVVLAAAAAVAWKLRDRWM